MDIRIAVAWRRRRPARSSHNGFVFIFTLHSDRSPKAAPEKPRREISVRIRREIMAATYKAGRTPINSITKISECEVENYFVWLFGKSALSELHLKVDRSRFAGKGAPRCLSSLARERDRLSSCCLLLCTSFYRRNLRLRSSLGIGEALGSLQRARQRL